MEWVSPSLTAVAGHASMSSVEASLHDQTDLGSGDEESLSCLDDVELLHPMILNHAASDEDEDV